MQEKECLGEIKMWHDNNFKVIVCQVLHNVYFAYPKVSGKNCVPCWWLLDSFYDGAKQISLSGKIAMLCVTDLILWFVPVFQIPVPQDHLKNTRKKQEPSVKRAFLYRYLCVHSTCLWLGTVFAWKSAQAWTMLHFKHTALRLLSEGTGRSATEPSASLFCLVSEHTR